jgi:hypothetical protein
MRIACKPLPFAITRGGVIPGSPFLGLRDPLSVVGDVHRGSGPLGANTTGLDQRHVDPERSELLLEHPGEALDSPLGCLIGAKSRGRIAPADRGDLQDLAARLLAEDGDGGPGEVDDAQRSVSIWARKSSSAKSTMELTLAQPALLTSTSSRPKASAVASPAAAACARSVTSRRTAGIVLDELPKLVRISGCGDDILAGGQRRLGQGTAKAARASGDEPASNIASSTVGVVEPGKMPALLTSTSMCPPSASRAASASSCEVRAEPSSAAARNCPWPPASWIALTTSAPRDASRPLRTTLAPWAAKATAIARPMLLVAPVTSAVFPLHSLVHCVDSDRMIDGLDAPSGAELLGEGGFVEDLPVFNDELVFDAK